MPAACHRAPRSGGPRRTVGRLLLSSRRAHLAASAGGPASRGKGGLAIAPRVFAGTGASACSRSAHRRARDVESQRHVRARRQVCVSHRKPDGAWLLHTLIRSPSCSGSLASKPAAHRGHRPTTSPCSPPANTGSSRSCVWSPKRGRRVESARDVKRSGCRIRRRDRKRGVAALFACSHLSLSGDLELASIGYGDPRAPEKGAVVLAQPGSDGDRRR